VRHVVLLAVVVVAKYDHLSRGCPWLHCSH